MVSDFWTFTLLSWFLKVIFLLIFLPLNRLDNASKIPFGVLLEDTRGIKWSLMESVMILLALIISFLYLAFASSPSGSATSSFMKPSRSFSYRMSKILYLHALKFSTPLSFSSSLVLFIIFNKMRTWNGNRRNNNYLEKDAFGSPSLGWPRV